MKNSCDVAIVGAGPYGLSLAANLSALNIDFRIFGKTLDTWRHHMPKDMLLKSDGIASNLDKPGDDGTLKAYCAARNIPYADHGKPVSLDLFNEYSSWFQKRFVPGLEETNVTRITRNGDGFTLELETGERVNAKSVVLAVGITWFAQMAGALKDIPSWAASHSFAHRDVSQFKGRDVAVLGAGASAIDLAALLHDSGANVQIVARANNVRFHAAPDASDASLLRQIKSPSTGIGPGWRSFFCVNTPLLFHRLPESLRLRATRNHLGPAPGWFMRERVEGRIPMLLGHDVLSASTKGESVELNLADSTGEKKTAIFDHVISATGYRPDLARLPFLSLSLLAEIAKVENTPILSDHFETSASDFYVVGPAAANAFGPLMRFMVGSEFVAPRVAAQLSRRLGASRSSRAA
ncbi:MAG TPA: NAD(P)-binding domain-containing protein [Rhizomicrobium sp.]|nr:NAD(P)-binding domain-containing protein [Rhizomicrobium sp.]